MHEMIFTQDAPSPIGPYSQAIQAQGLVFVSGQIPIDPKTGEVVGEEISMQTRQVMRNLMAVLQAAGSSADKVIKTTIFLAHLGDFPGMNQVYGEYFAGIKPARSTVAVGGLPKNVLIEIDAVALA